MRVFLTVICLAAAVFCGADDISLQNWSFVGKKKSGSAVFENGKLVIKSGRNRWSLRNGNRSKAVPGKAVKLSLDVEVLPPSNAMMFIRLYSVSGNKVSEKEYNLHFSSISKSLYNIR